MIKIGESPEKDGKINKFIAKSGDGQRGLILALNDKEDKAIILALNNSCKGDVLWGKLYLIKEISQDQYPEVVNLVNSVPNTSEWHFRKDLMR